MALLAQMEADLFKALAHPIRIEILNLLADDRLCVCEIYEELGQSQSNISQHLNKLKQNNLVISRKDGLKVYYSLEDKKIVEVIDLAEKIIVDQIENTKKELNS